ncbi:NAD(P)-binding domain-containing protein [Falsiroseomonas selenitidurans]|uniref:NAD(P)/FAD-dependent oxidoreductase n=1 Tax=Falsiroseomonas selenitidurans TaxID=2716335 RepID=A0ABX1DYB2_9PROT|nr:NAD(P)/FAD-dependent oxidoreductase [Falsiroseomonas selenitidurans]NKC29885.1 NAD(P)/FAD-dependent oxidoreductase [Falsiroseomonas selenitidurans]
MPEASPPGLAALEAQLARDLQLLNLPPKSWVPETPGVWDVVVVGAGLSGLCAAAALRFLGIARLLVLDRAPEGLEGPWVTTARMRTLRTAKEVAGPALGLPALTFRAWFEAQHGAAAWAAMERIPRGMWMDYMVWYRRVLDLPVRNGVAVTDMRPDGAGPIRLDLAAGDPLFARRVVLATGIDGLGGPGVPAVVRDLPRHLWAHSAEAIDMAALAGKRVGVVGAGASAMDNAASALEAGAASVDLLIRRAEMPRVDKFTGIGSKGMAHGFLGLPMADKWRFFRLANAAQLPAPRPSVLRVSRHANARFHFASPILAAAAQGDALRVTTPRFALTLDFLILATGFDIDPARRPELARIAPHIRRWSDSYAPPAEEQDALLGTSPDLGPGFEFQQRTPGACPGLERIACFAFPAVLTHGKLTSGIPSVSDGARRLAEALVRSLFVEDRARIRAQFEAYDTPELLGDEWQVFAGEIDDAAA